MALERSTPSRDVQAEDGKNVRHSAFQMLDMPFLYNTDDDLVSKCLAFNNHEMKNTPFKGE